MSSLRNAAYRRNHRERAQPFGRQRFGLLEKHKDYVLRAKDYHRKSDQLKNLRQKAATRNEDEFYFKMINTKTKGGVHIKERSTVLGQDMMKILRTQDLSYILRQRTIEAKKIEKLRSEMPFIGNDDLEISDEAEIQEELQSITEFEEEFDVEEPKEMKLKKAKHIVFVDNDEEVEKFDPVKFFDTVPELVNRKHNRILTSILKSQPIASTSFSEHQKELLMKQNHKQLELLKARMLRLKKLDKAAREIQIQKALLSKGKRQKIGKDSDNLPVFKWTDQRKR